MARIRLNYVHRFRDRHGKLRFYFRRAGFKRVPLPGLPGSAEFMEAYSAALAGVTGRLEVGAKRIIPGTVTASVLAYLGSASFALLAPDTRAVRASILQRLAREHGDKRVALMQRDHVQRMLDARAFSPGAARNFLTALRVLMRFAMNAGLRTDDPTAGVKSFKVRSDGWHTWTEDEIAAFEEAHPIGSMARLALALLLYTAQPRSDTIRMGRQHVRSGSIQVRQQKTGTELSIPIHPTLQTVLDGTPFGALDLSYYERWQAVYACRLYSMVQGTVPGGGIAEGRVSPWPAESGVPATRGSGLLSQHHRLN